jgi:hypothetical protein
MEPYQKASESMRAGDEYHLRLLKNAGLTALGGAVAGTGSRIANTLVPAVSALINPHVPEHISKAGLNKVDPRFGKFIQGAMEMGGYSFDEVREYLGDKVEKSKDKRNII